MPKGRKIYSTPINCLGVSGKDYISRRLRYIAILDIKKKGFVRCNVCKSDFYSVKRFVGHLTECFKPFHICAECDTGFSDEYSLKWHYGKYHTNIM